MSEKLIAQIRSRVEQCRRLAGTINDARTAAILRQMAAEGEAEIKRLEAENRAKGRD
jgi:hypothetical protein